MPVDSRHPEFDINIDAWTKCRDVYAGEGDVKRNARKYLRPIDHEQPADEYRAYVDRAILHEAFGRTVDGCVGAIARRDHVIDLPFSMAGMFADADGQGASLNEVVKLMASEVLITGRAGVIVDIDEKTGVPTLIVCPAESITNWSADGIVRHETVYETDPVDAFRQVAIDQYRHMHLVDGAYLVTVWRKETGGGKWFIYDEITPSSRGKPLEEIPFFWLSFAGCTPAIKKPPLLGLANASLNYFRMSADLQHGRHWTAIPSLVISGADNDEPIRVGGNAAILLKNADAKAYYCEFSGSGLGSLEIGLTEVVAQMATLGTSVFGRTGMNETASAARIRAGAESSILLGVVDAIEDTLQAALRFAAEWMRSSEAPTIRLNREFHDVALDPQMLTGMVSALQAGAVTAETFGHMLDQAQMLPPAETKATL